MWLMEVARERETRCQTACRANDECLLEVAPAPWVLAPDRPVLVTGPVIVTISRPAGVAVAANFLSQSPNARRVLIAGEPTRIVRQVRVGAGETATFRVVVTDSGPASAPVTIALSAP
jgi:hypothetical protein